MNEAERYKNEAYVLTKERDEAVAEVERLRALLKASLRIIGHPDDAVTQAMWQALEGGSDE